jgi:hypothetical protein
MLIIVENDGPLIRATNFWESDTESNGLCFLSTNARAFRLLLPRQWESELSELSTAKLVVVSKPRNPSDYMIELMFDDGSPKPYCIHLGPSQVDRFPSKEDHGRNDLECTVWTQPRRNGPHQALRRPAAFRFVPRLPWAKPWAE